MRPPAWICLGLALSAGLRAEEAAVSPDALLEALRGNASPRQLEVMDAFAKQPDAAAAIPRLLKVLQADAPRMDNNICLALERILEAHPEADCPLDPLVETLSRRLWTSQQKGAQALCAALKPANWAGREEALCRSLIPLLTSQRPRVFQASLRCLRKITGEAMGPDPDAWKAWYEKRFPGRTLDLRLAVYELILVIRPLGGPPATGAVGPPSPAYELNGEPAADRAALRACLEAWQRRAAEGRLTLGAVIQIPDEAMARLASTGDLSLVKEAMQEARTAGLEGFTVSPASDGFRDPYRPPPAP